MCRVGKIDEIRRRQPVGDCSKHREPAQATVENADHYGCLSFGVENNVTQVMAAWSGVMRRILALPARSIACRNDDGLDAIARIGEPDADAGANRRGAFRNPRVPDGIHVIVVGHVGKI